MKRANLVLRKIIALSAIPALYLGGAALYRLDFVSPCHGWNTLTADELAVLSTLLLMVTFAMYGLARDRPWGRWAGLGVGLFSTWYAGTMSVKGWSDHSGWGVLAGVGALLLLSLLGRSMYQHYDGQTMPLPKTLSDKVRLTLVRWACIVGISFLPFGVSSAFASHAQGWSVLSVWHTPIMIGLMAVFLAGVVLVVRMRTAGVLLIALAGTAIAWLFGPVSGYGGVAWFEVACRSGHTLVYLVPLVALSAPILRILRGRSQA